MRRFRVPALHPPGTEVRLDDAASHHLLVVCRHPRGGSVVLFDGSGQQTATLTSVQEGVAVLTTSSEASRPPQTAPTHLVLAVPKGSALEHALRMATEIGVTEIHPALALRSVRRADRPERWRRIIEAACQQCGRTDVPQLHPLSALRDAAARVPSQVERRVGVPNAPHLPSTAEPAALAVGPEGGFAPAEIAHLLRENWVATGFARNTLRADTAVAVGLACLRTSDPT